MDGIKQTLDAAGASFKDVVHMFVFRARPQMGDIGRASRVINSGSAIGTLTAGREAAQAIVHSATPLFVS